LEALLKKLYGSHFGGLVVVDQGFASHLAWGLVFALFGQRLGGFWACVISSALWCAYAFFREFVEEAPEPTRWSDIISRCAGPVLVVAVEAFLRSRS
jgi:hypothetical protein